MAGSFTRLGFLDADEDPARAEVVLVGLPYDRTASFKSGSRFAPDAIRRAATDGIETYDPVLDRDLEDVGYADPGDLHVEENTNPERWVDAAIHAFENEMPIAIPVIGLGGEHTVTYPLLDHTLKSHPDLGVLVFDAHTDLRDEYEGSSFSHACILSRVIGHVGAERVATVGVRSGLKEEFAFARENNLLFDPTPEGIQAALTKLGERPLYISVDLDGFDPSVCPGVGTPEPGGFTWRQFEQALQMIAGRSPLPQQPRSNQLHTVVGGDVVELLPEADPSGRSTVLAARVTRMLLLLAARG